MGSNIDIQAQETLDAFLKAVLQANEHVNLTAVRDYDEARVLHVEDSLTGAEIARELLAGPYADLGSGCGFPGVALALALDTSVDLVDSLQKKMRALAGILESLGLGDRIHTHAERIEEYSQQHPGEYNLITARALAATRVVLELASPLLEIGGHVLLYKSSAVDDEIAEAEPMLEKVGMAFERREELVLSNGDPRTLVVYRKVAEPTIQLPRRTGKAQKTPLK